MAHLDLIRDAVAKLNGERADIVDRIDELEQRRDFIMGAPLAKSDLIARMNRYCDGLVGTVRESLRECMRATAEQPFMDPSPMDHPLRLLIRHPLGTRGGDNALEHALLAVLAEPFKQFIGATISTWPNYPADSECGPPPAERVAELERIDDEIAKLNRDLQTLTAEATAAGLRIDA